ncbi:putative ABC-type xenobiotic transporter [Helianthus annuus]|nr:putative ABC-type xenobiotic transporter [Helianthus annuus]KAJ0897901.1 putative ABC-type xenobiotic transporter [Helianthus annuus]KAJ0954487.1 putative ABC-type xenobiotic transporter [Helianthus annuus]
MLINMFNGLADLSFTVMRLPVVYKQRDLMFHPPWAFTLPAFLLRIPMSMIESILWTVLLYWGVDLAPDAGRFFKHLLLVFLIQNVAAGLFRLIAGVCKTMNLANTGGSVVIIPFGDIDEIRGSQHAVINPAVTIFLRLGAGGHGAPPLHSQDGRVRYMFALFWKRNHAIRTLQRAAKNYHSMIEAEKKKRQLRPICLETSRFGFSYICIVSDGPNQEFSLKGNNMIVIASDAEHFTDSTVIMIAHRITSVLDSAMVLVLEQGLLRNTGVLYVVY